ncbi:MAG: FeoB-associated Cys-rich membrane protein [Longicatena sp.]|nr:FeoB-associated Cys-rich membrane protein [Longicatena sp.]
MNLSTFLISAGLVIICALIVSSMKKNKSCGNNCGSCSTSSLCKNSKNLYDQYQKDHKQ